MFKRRSLLKRSTGARWSLLSSVLCAVRVLVLVLSEGQSTFALTVSNVITPPTPAYNCALSHSVYQKADADQTDLAQAGGDDGSQFLDYYDPPIGQKSLGFPVIWAQESKSDGTGVRYNS